MGVNLPRWGLKRLTFLFMGSRSNLCKFTPLGFETFLEKDTKIIVGRVNLPRWGLKHGGRSISRSRTLGVNLPRWGLKLALKPEISFEDSV